MSGGPGTAPMAGALGVQVLEPQAVHSLGHVLQPEQECLVPARGRARGGVSFPRVQISVEAAMGEAQHPMALWVAPGGQTGPTGARCRKRARPERLSLPGVAVSHRR